MSRLKQFKIIQSQGISGLWYVLELVKVELKDFLTSEAAKKKAELEKFVRAELVDKRGEPGTPGKTPEKFVDYFTDAEVELLTTVVAANVRDLLKPRDGKDADEAKIIKTVTATVLKELPQLPVIPTLEEMRETIQYEVAKYLFGKDAKNVSSEEIRAIAKSVQEGFVAKDHAEPIARSLEGLKGNERLDYFALKNLPTIPSDRSRSKTMFRGGGGDTVRYYDLSSSTDGSTKTFTIPTNSRIVWVGGTDAPGGQYRQTTDYTGSGTTTLTLTAQVAAPTTGATLHLMYVE